MFYKRRSTDFSFLDLPRALWYFLGPERWAFLFYSVVLLGCFCYVVVPPLIVGVMTNFLLGYTKTDAFSPSTQPRARNRSRKVATSDGTRASASHPILILTLPACCA